MQRLLRNNTGKKCLADEALEREVMTQSMSCCCSINNSNNNGEDFDQHFMNSASADASESSTSSKSWFGVDKVIDVGRSSTTRRRRQQIVASKRRSRFKVRRNVAMRQHSNSKPIQIFPMTQTSVRGAYFKNRYLYLLILEEYFFVSLCAGACVCVCARVCERVCVWVRVCAHVC